MKEEKEENVKKRRKGGSVVERSKTCMAARLSEAEVISGKKEVGEDGTGVVTF